MKPGPTAVTRTCWSPYSIAAFLVRPTRACLAVRRGAGDADRAEDGRHVDDGATAVGGDRRQLGAQAVEDGVEVDLDHAAPAVHGVVADRRVGTADAGVVDRDAQGSERVGGVDRLLGDLRVGDVADEGLRRAAVGDDLRHDGLGRVRLEVRHQHGRTVGGQQSRDGPADARASPGDDRGAFGDVVAGHDPVPF
jgi:hypothetical protein